MWVDGSNEIIFNRRRWLVFGSLVIGSEITVQHNHRITEPYRYKETATSALR